MACRLGMCESVRSVERKRKEAQHSPAFGFFGGGSSKATSLLASRLVATAGVLINILISSTFSLRLNQQPNQTHQHLIQPQRNHYYHPTPCLSTYRQTWKTCPESSRCHRLHLQPPSLLDELRNPPPPRHYQ